MKFTTRHLLLATAIIAAGLAGIRYAYPSVSDYARTFTALMRDAITDTSPPYRQMYQADES